MSNFKKIFQRIQFQVYWMIQIRIIGGIRRFQWKYRQDKIYESFLKETKKNLSDPIDFILENYPSLNRKKAKKMYLEQRKYQPIPHVRIGQS